MCAVIRSYMTEQITAFQFDEVLSDISRQTEDFSVRQAAKILWYFYDDVHDHKVVASRECWSCFHHLLLILESDCKIDVQNTRKLHWTVRQLIALFALFGFGVLAIYLGWGEHLHVISVPFGVVSMLLYRWHAKSVEKAATLNMLLAPFSSFSELMAVRRSVRNFVKVPYRKHLGECEIPKTIADRMIWFLGMVMWLLCAPVVLFFQVFPEKCGEMKVKLTCLSQSTKKTYLLEQ
jgi:hypothetical protein